MPQSAPSSPLSNSGPLIRLLEAALGDDRMLLTFGDGQWQQTPALYRPILEDLLRRARLATEQDEIAFLTRQSERVLQLRAVDLPPGSAAGDFVEHGSLLLQLPLEPVRRQCSRLADLLALPDCRRDLSHLLGSPDAAARVSIHDLLLRSLGRVLLVGWGAREILGAPIPARCRPNWDLFAPELKLLVVARARPRPPVSLTPVPHHLALSLCNHKSPRHVEVRLRSEPAVPEPGWWTGLRWEEEQRLRAMPVPSGKRAAPAGEAQAVVQAVARLDRRLRDLVAQGPPSAPWTWQRGRSRRSGVAPL